MSGRRMHDLSLYFGVSDARLTISWRVQEADLGVCLPSSSDMDVQLHTLEGHHGANYVRPPALWLHCYWFVANYMYNVPTLSCQPGAS